MTKMVSLLPHPDVPNDGVRQVAAGVAPAGPDSLRFQYLLQFEPRLIRVPPPVPDGGRADRLWAHTCFEAFVGFADFPAYLELNFSPSGQWAAYRFDAYRQGMAAALELAPRLELRRMADRLELQAEVKLVREPANRRLRLALTTVVEDERGRLSYWAARHPAGRPDFHHPEGFSLELELPNSP